MGEKCLEVFREAATLGGIPAKMRLAALARMSSAEAQVVTDDPAIVARLRRAFDQVKVEMARRSTGTFPSVQAPPPAPAAPTDGATTAKLRKQLDSLVDLMAQRSIMLGDVNETARRIDELASAVLSVARVSVWLYDDRRTKIVCLDLFEAESRKHSAGLELHSRDFGPYFDALQNESTIMAHDAQTDVRTRCFTASYLQPLGIGAMLDVPIWAGGKMVGVICHEHIGGARTWQADEERFGYLLSNFVALAMERGRASSPGDHR
ncbi:MAG: GAF domain-containing protein [Polyangiaceae bacterium]|nr:GAF domain-containing protein [Polyangiaceae bacterium]